MAYSFTAYSSVRNLLGVSAEEVPDSLASDQIFADKLTQELAGIDPSIEDKYATASSLVTAAAAAFVLAFDVFVVHAMAEFLLPGLPMFSPKSVTDGKAAFSRYSDSPYESTADRITAEYIRTKRSLGDNLAVYDGATPTAATKLSHLAVSSPAYDPVTGA